MQGPHGLTGLRSGVAVAATALLAAGGFLRLSVAPPVADPDADLCIAPRELTRLALSFAPASWHQSSEGDHAEHRRHLELLRCVVCEQPGEAPPPKPDTVSGHATVAHRPETGAIRLHRLPAAEAQASAPPYALPPGSRGADWPLSGWPLPPIPDPWR